MAYVAYLLALMLSSLLVGLLGDLLPTAINVGALLNLIMFMTAGVFCLLFIKWLGKNNLSAAEFGIHREQMVKTIAIGGVLGVCFFGLTLLIESYSDTLRAAGEQVTTEFTIGKSFLKDLFLLANVCLLAPVAEEIVFRGAIFNVLLQSLKKISTVPSAVAFMVAMVISAYAFVSAHGGGGQDAQLFLIATLGVFAALAMYMTKSLFGAIIVHTINNTMTMIFTLFTLPGLESGYRLSLIFAALVCVVLCIPLGLLFGRILGDKHA